MRRGEVRSCVRLLVFALMGAVTASAQTSQPAPQAALGWSWLDMPRAVTDFDADGALSGKIENVTYEFRRPAQGPLTLTISQKGGNTRQGVGVEYRGVAIDFDGRRHTFTFGVSGGNDTKYTWNLRLPESDLQPENVALVGVEVLTPAGRKVLAADAQRRAREAGVELLPLPVVGEPFEFRLTTADGRVASSEEWRGKVVVIDCWATWCMPCMQKMPNLVKLYEELHPRGLEIVGINFDRRFDMARRAIDTNGLSWPQVYVKDDEALRTLWHEASSVSILPRLIVIDRAGVVRADCTPMDLEEAVRTAIGK